MSRAWLAGMLWPDCSPPRALANLRTSLNDLRQALTTEACRLRSPSTRTLWLDLTDAETDVVAFDQLVGRGDASSLAQAVGLYRGPLLEGCSEEWVFQERRAREEAYLGARERLAAQAQAARDLGAAEQHLRAAVGADPLRERAHRALMEVLATGGNYAAALLTYRELRLLLHRELNAEPDPETTALFQQIRVEARAKADGASKQRGVRESGRPLSIALPPDAPRSARPVPPVAPPLRSLGTSPNNLPRLLTSFIGRERQMTEIQERLGGTPLLTLTGAGGCGKTRLALQVAAARVADYVDGIWLVELAALADPTLVRQQVAAALGLQEETSRPLTETLVDYLRPRSLLLVLDNCEHLLSACAHLAEDLLRRCRSLQVLATSRESLGIAGEVTYRVPSLSLPDLRHLTQRETDRVSAVAQCEAVRLFVERAVASQPGFAVQERNAMALAQVCQRLDGIPLAIELAAARVNALPVEKFAERLDDRFRLLTGGSRTALPRHQTLRALIDWSYDLLTEAERALLRRLSVFAGGWTMEAAEAVCAGNEIEPWEVLDLLTSLAQKSLVQYEQQGEEGRYRLLETIRQYGAEKLAASGEEVALRSQHRDWFLGVAEQAEAELQGRERGEWLARLEREHDDLRAALTWSVERGEAELGLRLGGALAGFWAFRGYFTEGRERLAGALAAGEAGKATRAKALNAAGDLASGQADFTAARSLCEESLRIRRELGDLRGIADSLDSLGIVASERAEYAAALALHEEALAIQRELGDQQGIATSLHRLGNVSYDQGDYAAAGAFHEESLPLFRKLGDRWGIAVSLNGLAAVAKKRGDYEAARALDEEGLAIQRELGNQGAIAVSLSNLGLVAHEQGDYEAARALHEESLAIRRERGNQLGIAYGLKGLAAVAGAQGELERAARLFGAAEALRQALSTPLPPSEHATYERQVAAVRAGLGEEAFAAEWAAGRAMSSEEAAAYALEPAHPGD